MDAAGDYMWQFALLAGAKKTCCHSGCVNVKDGST